MVAGGVIHSRLPLLQCASSPFSWPYPFACSIHPVPSGEACCRSHDASRHGRVGAVGMPPVRRTGATWKPRSPDPSTIHPRSETCRCAPDGFDNTRAVATRAARAARSSPNGGVRRFANGPVAALRFVEPGFRVAIREHPLVSRLCDQARETLPGPQGRFHSWMGQISGRRLYVVDGAGAPGLQAAVACPGISRLAASFRDATLQGHQHRQDVLVGRPHAVVHLDEAVSDDPLLVDYICGRLRQRPVRGCILVEETVAGRSPGGPDPTA